MDGRQRQALEEQERRSRRSCAIARSSSSSRRRSNQHAKVPPKRRDLSDQYRTRADDGARAESEERHCRSPAATRPSAWTDRERARSRRSNPAPATAANPTPPAPPANPNALALPDSPLATIVRNETVEEPDARDRRPGVLSDAIKNVQRYSQGESLQNVQGNGDFGPSIQFDSKGVDFGPWLRRFRRRSIATGCAVRRDVAARPRRADVQRAQGRHASPICRSCSPRRSTRSRTSAFNAIMAVNPTMPLPPEYPDEKARSRSRSTSTRSAVAMTADARQQVGLFLGDRIAVYAAARAIWS